MVKVSPVVHSNSPPPPNLSKPSKLPGKKYLKKLEQKQNNHRQKWLSKLIFHPESSFRLSWDVMMLIIIIYQALTIPYFICFSDDLSYSMQVFEVLIYLAFFIDILLSFNTGYYIKGSLINKRRLIAREYLKLWFWIDLISSFPYNWVVEGVFTTDAAPTKNNKAYTAPKIIRVIRIVRFLRILRLLRLAKLKKIIIKIEDYIASNTLANLFVLLRLLSMCFLGAHWVACLWFYLANQESDTHPYTWIDLADIQNASLYEQYVTSLYWVFTTIATIGYGDIYPITMYEKIFAIVTMIVSSGAFAYTVGSLGSLLSKHTALEKDYRETFVAVNKYVKAKALPRELQFRVKRYLEYVWEKKKQNHVNDKELLTMLSEPLRDEIYANINAKVINHCKVFTRYEANFISHLTRTLETETYAPKDNIFEEGEMSHKLYFILSGSVEIYHHSTLSSFALLTNKHYFGEIAFFLGKCRSASAVCYEFVDLLSVSRSSLLFYLEKFPEAKLATALLNMDCAEGNYTSLQVRCYLCEELGHVATKCRIFLINLNQEKMRNDWISSKNNRGTIELQVTKSLSPRFRRKSKNVKKVKYVLNNVRGRPRTSFEMFPNDMELSKTIHEVSDFSKFKESVKHSNRPSVQIDEKIRPRYSLFFMSDSDNENPDKVMRKDKKSESDKSLDQESISKVITRPS